MATISSLYVSLKLSAESFNNDIKAAAREAKAFEKDIKDMKETLTNVGGAMVAVGGAVLVSFAAAIKKTADFGDAMNDAAKRTGLTTEQLSKLKLAADTSGSSFDGLQTGLKQLGKNMELAAAGGKTQMAAFTAAGISARDLAAAHGDVNVILNKLADTFKSSEDGAGKTAVSMTLLGKSGTDLIPMLNEGSAGLKAWGDEAERTGRVVSTEAAAAADEFNDRLTVLEGSIGGLVGTVGNAFIPMLTDLANRLVPIISSFREWVEAHPNLIKAVGALALIITGAGGLLLGIAGLLAIWPALVTAFALITGPIGLVVIGIGAAVAAIIYFRNEISQGLLAALNLLVTQIQSFLQWVSNLAAKVGLGGLATKLQDASKATADFGQSMQTSLAKGLEHIGMLKTTETTVKAVEKAQTDATESTRKHTISLGENTAEMEKLKREHEAAAKKIEEGKKKLDELVTRNRINLGKMLQDQIEFNTNVITLDALRERSARETIDRIVAKNAAAMGKYLNDQVEANNKWIGVMSDDFSKGLGDQIGMMKGMQQGWDENAKEATETLKKENLKAVNDVRESAGKIFDDMFIKGESVFSSLTNLLKGGALSIGRTIFEDVVGFLGGPIKKAFDDFFIGLLESTGIKTFLTGLGNKLGGALGSVFGGGAGAAGTFGPSLAQLGAGSNAAGSAAGGASGLAGGIAGGAIAAAGSIIGTLMEKGNLKRTEENTRETRDWLELQTKAWNPLFFADTEILGMISDKMPTGEDLYYVAEGLRQGIYNALWEVTNAVLGALADIRTALHETGTSTRNAMTQAATAASVNTVSAFTRAVAPAGTGGTGFLNYGIPGTSSNLALAAGFTSNVPSFTSTPFQPVASSFFPTPFQPVMPSFDRGGIAQQSGPAMVQKGELMIPRGQVGQIIALLQQIASKSGDVIIDNTKLGKVQNRAGRYGSNRMLATELVR